MEEKLTKQRRDWYSLGGYRDVKFLSKQPFSIRMTYFCSERHVGGIADHVAKKRQPSLKHFSSPLLSPV